MVFYIVFILVLNIFLTQLGAFKINADITIQELIEIHNQERSSKSLGPLTYNSQLSDSAAQKSRAMLDSDCWSHYCPDGKSPWDFFKSSGYLYTYAGENLAEGFSTTQNVMNAWMNSPTHRDNILNGNYTEIGFGFAYGRYQGKNNNTVLTVHFGTPAFPDVSVSQESQEVAGTNTGQTSLKISSPENESVINSSSILVSGEVQPEGSEVLININSEEHGRVVANGINFTYKSPKEYSDGDYLVQAKVKNSFQDFSSQIVKVTLDGQSPSIFENTIKASFHNESSFVISFSTSIDVIKINSSPLFFQTSQTEKGSWKIYFSNEVLDQDQIRFELFDQSGNTNEFFIYSKDLKNSLNFETKNNDSDERLLDTSIPINFVKRISNGGLQTILPVIFIVYLGILLLIDFIFLAKTKMLGKVSRKSHLAISLFSITFLIIGIGGATGSILNGINSL